MCGIAGFLDPVAGCESAEMSALAASMGDTLAHRGPDGAGTWVDPASGLGLAHRRLAVVDLSHHGHQPMVSPRGRWVVTVNGEVYNHRELRLALESAGVRFRGHSDIEVLTSALDTWGLDEALTRFNGMFAFGAWDRQQGELSLVRDRLGEKPLYYAMADQTLLFGSELKALRRHPAFVPRVDRDSLALMLRYGCVPAPRCILEGVRHLEPGRILTVRCHDGRLLPPRERVYWSAQRAALAGLADPLPVTAEQSVDLVADLLGDAVRLRTQADVPVGAFLSGGADSSLITALAQAGSGRPARTFTIGFDDAGYDESAQARKIAEHLGTDHVDVRLRPEEVLALVPELPRFYDEPFGDSSQLPTMLVSRLARTAVTVALSGDGGDELFAGYNRHQWADRLWRQARLIPAPVRHRVAGRLERLPADATDRLFGRAAPLLPARLRVRTPAVKVAKLTHVLASTSPEELYLRLRSQCQDPERLLTAHGPGGRKVSAPPEAVAGFDATERMLLLDLMGYLPDDILTKVDRASMSVGLEVRVPFLDHRLVELAWQLPTSVKLRDGQTKWVLRQVLDRYVPRELVDLPKMGFGVPLGAWLRGPLRPWVEDLLDVSRLRREGHLDPEAVQQLWRRHRDGPGDSSQELWNVLAFQSWLDYWA